MHPQQMLSALVVASSLVFSTNGYAQSCPAAGAKLKVVQDAISDFQKNTRAPSGADCAYRWASNHLFSPSMEKGEIDFFNMAADVQRAAFKKRADEKASGEADDYLDKEINIRRRFLDQALNQADAVGSDLRRAVVRHISSLVGAMALRRQYEGAAEYMGKRSDLSVIDDEAWNVWLQAVWSCAKWDGKKANVCEPSTRQICKGEISTFLDSVSSIKSRNLSVRTKRDILQLKEVAKGCFK